MHTAATVKRDLVHLNVACASAKAATPASKKRHSSKAGITGDGDSAALHEFTVSAQGIGERTKLERDHDTKVGRHRERVTLFSPAVQGDLVVKASAKRCGCAERARSRGCRGRRRARRR
jgi:hypothetical protein